MSLDPSPLVRHLFDLAHSVARATRALPVLKAETPEVGVARTALFAAARAVLAEGMGILGLQVLRQM